MNIKWLVPISLLIGFVSSSALADDFDLNALGKVTSQASSGQFVADINVKPKDDGSFDDYIRFYTDASTTINSIIGGFHGITDISGDMHGASFSGSVGDGQIEQHGTFQNSHYYTLHLTGHVNTGGLNQGEYSVHVASVPEPESYAMLLAGLGVMGAIVRRRKKNTPV